MSVPRFWREQPARYNLYGAKCSKCNSVFFPPRDICLKCDNTPLNPQKLRGEGKIVTYTTLRVASPGFEKQVPYTIAIIELEEGPRLTAQIVDCEPSEIKIGQKVKSCFRKISEDGKAGAIYYGYKFKISKS